MQPLVQPRTVTARLFQTERPTSVIAETGTLTPVGDNVGIVPCLRPLVVAFETNQESVARSHDRLRGRTFLRLLRIARLSVQ